MELCIHVCVAICLANVVNLSLEPEQCLERWLPLSLCMTLNSKHVVFFSLMNSTGS